MTEPSLAGSATILLVEDDDQVRSFVRTMLTHDGYRVVEARNGLEGYQLGTEQNGRFDLLLSDMLLPELSGYDLAVRLREMNPHLKVLFMTGYVEGDIVQRCVAELNAVFLDKPFQPAVLRARVKETLEGATAAPGAA